MREWNAKTEKKKNRRKEHGKLPGVGAKKYGPVTDSGKLARYSWSDSC